MLPRVHFLIEHAISQSVISCAVTDPLQNLSNGKHTLVESISSTIATFLCLVPGVKFSHSVTLDLIQMIQDVCFILDHFEECVNCEVEMEIFPSAVAESDLPHESEFLVAIQSFESAANLQLTLISTFVSYVQLRHRQELDDLKWDDELSVDQSHALFHGMEGSQEQISDLVISLEQLLKVATSINSDTDELVEVISRRTAWKSLDLAALILEDFFAGFLWDHAVVRISSAILQGTLFHIQEQNRNAAKADPVLSKQLAKYLLALYSDQVVSTQCTRTLYELRQTTLPALLQCASYLFSQGAESRLVDLDIGNAILTGLAFFCSKPNYQSSILYQISQATSLDSSGLLTESLWRATLNPNLCNISLPILDCLLESQYERCGDLLKSRLASFSALASVQSQPNQKTDNLLSNDRKRIQSDDGPSDAKRPRLDHPTSRKINSPLEEAIDDLLSKVFLDMSNTSGESSELNTGMAAGLLFHVIVYLCERKSSDFVCEFINAAESVSAFLCNFVEKLQNEAASFGVVSFVLNAANRGTSWNDCKSFRVLSDACRLKMALIPEHEMATTKNEILYPSDAVCSLVCNQGGKILRFTVKAIEEKGSMCRQALSNLCSEEATVSILGELLDAGKDEDETVRLLAWESIASSLKSCTNQDQLESLVGSFTQSEDALQPIHRNLLVSHLVEAAFSDPDFKVRDHAADNLGGVLLHGVPCALLVAYATNQEVPLLREHPVILSGDTKRAIERAVSQFVLIIDQLLFVHCEAGPSQLSLDDQQLSQLRADRKDALNTHERLVKKKSAVQALCSICKLCDFSTASGRLIFDKCLSRVVRLWSGFLREHVLVFPGACFGEVTRLFFCLDMASVIQTRLPLNCAFTWFDDALGPIADPLDEEAVQQQYKLLVSLLSLIPSIDDKADLSEDILIMSHLSALEQSAEEVLPISLAKMILKSDMDTLQLSTGFKIFLMYQKRYFTKGESPGSANLPFDRLPWKVKHRFKLAGYDVASQTSKLCTSSEYIEKLMPLVCQGAGKDELLFYQEKVLAGRLKIEEIFHKKNRLLLRGFVKELGRNTEPPPGRALQVANTYLGMNSNLEGGSQSSEWVSKNFMYIMVNLIQMRWVQKQPFEKLEDMRSLFTLLDFLQSDSGQMLPQIMATVSAAVAHPLHQETFLQKYLIESLKYYAVQSLNKFVRQICPSSHEAIADNLASLVVSLIPVLESEKQFGFDEAKTTRLLRIQSETAKTAVELMSFLAEGENGQKLAATFSRISFLFQLPALEGVKEALKQLGVVFDLLSGIEVSQRDTIKSATQSDSGSNAGDSKSTQEYVIRQKILSRHLETITTLLDHEDPKVRVQVLKHLVALLKENRDAFLSLVESESFTSADSFLTVVYRKENCSRGTITDLMQCLLSRCVHEDEETPRQLLATALGEIGPIGEDRLNGSIITRKESSSNDSHVWRLKSPPWQTHASLYGLHLVTKNLVTALRAATTSTDQHKVGYAIQQVLALLYQSPTTTEGPKELKKRGPMPTWMAEKLDKANVKDVVAPFWQTEFQMKEATNNLKPPFLEASPTYLSWISHWCRYMVERCHERDDPQFTNLFLACRSALKTAGGISVGEMLLPVLILHRLCFGKPEDFKMVVEEMKAGLRLEEGSPLAKRGEGPKVVNAVFSILDTFQHWVERDVEDRFRPSSRKRSEKPGSTGWNKNYCIMQIEDLLKEIPLRMQAGAALIFGMNARALRLLETSSRAEMSEQVYGADIARLPRPPKRAFHVSRAAGQSPCGDLMKQALSSLEDYESLIAYVKLDPATTPRSKILDSIRERESCQDWNGALHAYERALQFQGGGSSNTFNEGILQCLLELGQDESVLTQVKGVSSSMNGKCDEQIIPYAVQAAWRLGRWENLSQMAGDSVDAAMPATSDAKFHLSLGKAILAIQRGEKSPTILNIANAREAVMEQLAVACQDSYTQSCKQLVRLRNLQELEDYSLTKAQKGDAPAIDVEDWSRQLETASPESAVPLINVRIAISRLMADRNLEGSLFLDIGRRARKNGKSTIATSAFARADEAFNTPGVQASVTELSSLQLERAKLKHDVGESSEALRLLDLGNFESLAQIRKSETCKEVAQRVASMIGVDEKVVDEKLAVEVFVRSAMKSLSWMVDDGLKGGREIMSGFQVIHSIDSKSEAAHFHYAKYLEKIMESRINLRQNRSSSQSGEEGHGLSWSRALAIELGAQRNLLYAVHHYCQALALDLNHLYQALPRLLSLCFEFTSVDVALVNSVNEIQYSKGRKTVESQKADREKKFRNNQRQLKEVLANAYRQIPPQAFYSAMAQILSRASHGDFDMRQILVAILKRVLHKFPHQAMWHLAWLMQSKDRARIEFGEFVFNLDGESRGRDEAEMRKFLNGGKGFLKYLHNCKCFKHFNGIVVSLLKLCLVFVAVAKYGTNPSQREIVVKPWLGEVPISSFVPPVQAALTLSPSQYGNRSFSNFMRNIPRIREFSKTILVLSSKARPKKVRAFATLAELPPQQSSYTSSRSRSPRDIGEFHFLVKREDRGDLRKDARVQDLNMVINRLLLASSKKEQSVRSHRRLRMRTFAVTCLSEDTGILEWVPDTSSLRSLIHHSYNPYAPASSSKRRGIGLVNIGDTKLKSDYEKKCQDHFFSTGDLQKAARVFEDVWLRKSPPLLFWWFVQRFPNPHAWYEARTLFTQSTACACIVGHVIGLGDRHLENQLLDTSSGEIVHVDFDCLFDKGLLLARPGTLIDSNQ